MDAWAKLLNRYCLDGDIDAIQDILPEIRKRSDSYHIAWGTAMYHAGMGGHVETIKQLRDLFPVQEFVYAYGLRGAYRGGHIAVIELMVERGAKIRDEDCMTIACMYNRIDFVKFIINKNFTRKSIFEGILSAARQGHVELVKMLMEHHLELPNTPEEYLQIAYAACIGGDVEFLHEILGKLEHLRHFDSNTGLNRACQGGHICMVRDMLTRGPSKFHDALDIACSYGHHNIAHLMLAYDAKPNANVFYSACYWGFYDIYQIAKGYINLHALSYPEKISIFKIQVGYGNHMDMDILKDLLDTFGKEIYDEVFRYACNIGNIELVQVMLKNHSWVCLAGGLQKAAQYEYIEIVKLLIEQYNGTVDAYKLLPLVDYLLSLGMTPKQFKWDAKLYKFVTKRKQKRNHIKRMIGKYTGIIDDLTSIVMSYFV